MKKTILRILLWMARFAGSCGIGYLLGTIASKVLNLVVNEEFAEKHPFVTIMLWVLATGIACTASVLIVTYPLTWIFDWFDKKIDDIEDDPDWES